MRRGDSGKRTVERRMWHAWRDSPVGPVNEDRQSSRILPKCPHRSTRLPCHPVLEEVERGAEITITRHGKPVARLVPVGERVGERRLREAVAGLKRFRHGRRLGDVTLRELIEEGRR